MQELAYKTKFRLNILAGIIFGFSILLFFRLFYLQLVRGSDYARQAQQNRVQVIKVPAYRSIIYDRSGQNKLAYNRKSMSVIAIPFNIPEKPAEKMQVLSNASELLGMTIEEITNTIRDQAIDKYTPVVIKFDIDTQTLVRFKEHSDQFRGFYCENRPRRIYPLREKAAQLIGYTGIISKEEIKKVRIIPSITPVQF